MASSYTSRIALELQADGENPNSWGDILNNNVIQLVDDAVAAYTSVTLSSTDYALTTNDGATNQASSAMLEIVGTVSSDSNLIIPGVSKFYIVKDKSVRQNDAAIKIKKEQLKSKIEIRHELLKKKYAVPTKDKS